MTTLPSTPAANGRAVGKRPAHPLDNPAWHALTGPHAGFAVSAGPARRYAPDISVFAAVERIDDDGWAALADLAGPGGTILLARAGVPTPPAGWHERRRLQGHQMVLTSDPAAPSADVADPGRQPLIRPLTGPDVAEMLELTAHTRPGPFLAGTIRLGGYVGTEADGRLVAMAGRRMAIAGHVEVSGVCTHPDAAGRGLATALTGAVARSIVSDGATPFLHVTVGNTRARDVYERLGFTVRTTVDFVVLDAPTRDRTAPRPS